MLLQNGHHLINRIVCLFGNTGYVIMLIKRELLLQYFVHSLRALVTIGNDISNNPTFMIQQNKVNSPCIDANAHRKETLIMCSAQALNYMLHKSINIPAQMSILFMHTIGETIDFVCADFVLCDPSNNVSSA